MQIIKVLRFKLSRETFYKSARPSFCPRATQPWRQCAWWCWRWWWGGCRRAWPPSRPPARRCSSPEPGGTWSPEDIIFEIFAINPKNIVRKIDLHIYITDIINIKKTKQLWPQNTNNSRRKIFISISMTFFNGLNQNVRKKIQ